MLLAFLSLTPKIYAQDFFYDYYDNGNAYMGKGDYVRAAEEFKAAISLEFEEKNNKRTYGTRFIEYYPHRELGIAYYHVGETDLAKKELELSTAYRSTKRAKEYLDKIGLGTIAALSPDEIEQQRKLAEKEKLLREQEARLANEREEKAVKEAEKKKKEFEEQKQNEEEFRKAEEKRLAEEAKQREEVRKLEKEKQRKLKEQEEKLAREKAEFERKEKDLAAKKKTEEERIKAEETKKRLKEIEAQIAAERERTAKEEENRKQFEAVRLKEEAEKEKKAKEAQEKIEAERLKKEKEDQERAEVELQKLAEERGKLDEEKKNLENQRKIAKKGTGNQNSMVPISSLMYEPSVIPQVGSRLTLAVLPVESKDQKDLANTITEKLIRTLVNLRRFRVTERGAVDKVMREQDFQMTDFVNEKEAVEVGKLAGADALVMSTLSMNKNKAVVSLRVVDVETGETLTAAEARNGTGSNELDDLVIQLAVNLYNEIPLTLGTIVTMDGTEAVYLDIGAHDKVRRGTKCVAYREGEDIIHPSTKEKLGKKVTRLGELVVTEVQEKLATAKFVKTEKEKPNVGDRVVVK